MASRPSRLMASATARSGRCVVASATRKLPATSSMTGRGAWHSAARYSVWPLKAMPASLITLFCTGAVHSAANSPARQPCGGAVDEPQHGRGVAHLEPPRNRRACERLVQHRELAGRLRRRRAALVVVQDAGRAEQPRTRLQQIAVGEAHQRVVARALRGGNAQVRSDAGAFTTGEDDGSNGTHGAERTQLRAAIRRRPRRAAAAARCRWPHRPGSRAAARRPARARRWPCCRSHAGPASARCASRTAS